MPTWSFTVNEDNDMESLPPELYLSNMALQHDQFAQDMQLALNLARALGVPSFTCTGMRAQSPYTDTEVVDISVRGVQGEQIFAVMKGTVLSGPESGRNDPVLHEDERG